MKSKISPRGLAAGAVAWCLYLILMVSEASCTKYGSYCESGDMLLAAIIGVGGIVPAWFVADLFSNSQDS